MRCHPWKICAYVGALCFVPIGVQAADAVPSASTDMTPAPFKLGAGILWQKLRQSAPPVAVAPGSPAPVTLLQLRVERALLERSVGQTIECDQHVTDNILGTEVAGTAHTRGTTDVKLQPSDHAMVIHLTLTGTVELQSTGHNGPATLHSRSRTSFEAHKQITLGPDGFTATPATCKAEAELTIDRVEARGAGVRSEVVKRVAIRRAQQSKAEAEEVISRHTEERLNRVIDEQTKATIEKAQAVLFAQLLDSDKRPQQRPRLTFRGTTEYLEIALFHGDTAPEMAPPDQSAGLRARIHHTLVRRVVMDPKFLATAGSLLSANSAFQPAPSLIAPAASGNCKLTWSADQQWLTLEYCPAPTPAAVLAGPAQ